MQLVVKKETIFVIIEIDIDAIFNLWILIKF